LVPVAGVVDQDHRRDGRPSENIEGAQAVNPRQGQRFGVRSWSFGILRDHGASLGEIGTPTWTRVSLATQLKSISCWDLQADLRQRCQTGHALRLSGQVRQV